MGRKMSGGADNTFARGNQLKVYPALVEKLKRLMIRGSLATRLAGHLAWRRWRILSAGRS